MQHLAVLVEVGLQLHHHRRAERRARQFVGATPQHSHWPARHALREPCGIEGHVVSAVVAVAAGTLHVLHAHRLGIEAKCERQVAAQIEDALAVGPHVQANRGRAVVPARERARSPDRRMRYPWFGVARGQRARRDALPALAVLAHHVRLGRQLLQARCVRAVAPRCGSLPSGSARQQTDGMVGLRTAVAQHAEQVAIAVNADQPGRGGTAAVSACSNRESTCGGCSTRPCSEPSKSRSWM